MCPSKASPCVLAPRAHVETCVRVVPVHRETLRTYPQGFPVCHSTHHTPQQQQHTTTHGDRAIARQRQKKKTEKEIRRGKRRDKTRQKKREKRRDKIKRRKEKSREEKRRSREIRCVMCVVSAFLFFFQKKLPDPRIMSNFQNFHYQP